jgi:hypothetical protein
VDATKLKASPEETDAVVEHMGVCNEEMKLEIIGEM